MKKPSTTTKTAKAVAKKEKPKGMSYLYLLFVYDILINLCYILHELQYLTIFVSATATTGAKMGKVAPFFQKKGVMEKPDTGASTKKLSTTKAAKAVTKAAKPKDLVHRANTEKELAPIFQKKGKI